MSKLAYLKKGSILAMIHTQFFSALGDTGFRNIVALIIASPALVDPSSSVKGLAIAQIAFMLPYVILAPFVGNLSDRFPKKFILSFASGSRALILLCVLLWVIPSQSSILILYLTIFLTGVMAATYSPAKYGILPELTPKEGLVLINGAVESGTLLAILLGTIGSGILADWAGLWNRAMNPPVLSVSGFHTCLIALIAVFGASALFALLLPKKPMYAAKESHVSLGIHDYLVGLKEVFTYAPLRKAVLGVALFWTIAAGLNVLFFPFGQKYLHLSSDTAKTSLYFALSIGIIFGSSTVGFLPGSDRLACVRWSAVGFSFSLFAFAFCRNLYLAYGILVISGLFAGIYLIPLNAAMQRHSKRDMTSRVIATSNLLNNITMILISALFFVLSNIENPHIIIILILLCGVFMILLGGIPKWKEESLFE
ncbi:MAG: MFS transporter [Planctomycetota bacterium]|nr:MAG: MFS transporter [Planctomycetota bacterium]